MKFDVTKSLFYGVGFTLALLAGNSFAQTTDTDSSTTVESAETEVQDERKIRKQHFREMAKKRHKRMEKRMGEHLTKIDANGDGKVDLNEYLANAEQRFNDMDLDGDQLVTQEEAREAHKQMRAKKREEHRKALGNHYKEEQSEEGSE